MKKLSDLFGASEQPAERNRVQRLRDQIVTLEKKLPMLAAIRDKAKRAVDEASAGLDEANRLFTTEVRRAQYQSRLYGSGNFRGSERISFREDEGGKVLIWQTSPEIEFRALRA